MTISIILFCIAIYLLGFFMGFVTRDLVQKYRAEKETNNDPS